MKKIITVIISVLVLMFFVTVLENNKSYSNNDISENKLMVYSTYDEQVLKYLKDEFKAKAGIDIDFKVFNTSKDLENTLKKEKGAPNADFILGGDSNLYKRLSSEGLLEKNYPSWCSDIDGKDKDKDGYWYSCSKRILSLFYNSESLKDFPVITDVQSLGNPKYKGLITIEKPEENTTRALVATILYPYYKSDKLEDGFKVLSSIKANIKPEYVDYSKLISSIEAKEAGIGFAEIDKINKAKIKNNTPLTILNSDKQMIMIAEGCAILKNSKNINTAKLFEEFSAGPKVQLELANKFGIIPVHNVALNNSPNNIKDLNNKVINQDEINSNIDSWIERWNALTVEPPKENITNNNKQVIENKTYNQVTENKTYNQATENKKDNKVDNKQQIKTKEDESSKNKNQNSEGEEIDKNQNWE
ncbi:iron(III) transport system substrate-binding protein [Clostridium cavendishii DSM 21758]|uniref:Iron(III) transport system substrate-binding protein n=1 Tax=Clostridium cavendishii DSM 21758 TaxID=1121302 RepID=A0A1M6VMU8_9CLOT|nr:ABC transporter substrate-binding protein [Clostridium cavendishii]SHK82684.1 iron(III) transport system substrate-binding protein [Clostridium cavendishii DSM 21758]